MISALSRDLRAPAETVAKLADLLCVGPVHASRRRDVEDLSRSAQRLLAALNDLIDFSSLEAGEPDLTVEPFDLFAVVKDAASALQGDGAPRGLTVGVDMAEDCPRYIMGDVRRVRQVLMSLVQAALSGTSEGSILLHVSVDVAAYPFTVRFGVTDTGAGLSTEEQNRLFEPPPEMDQPVDGLMMPIAKRLAEAMGGGLGCSSVADRGTVFWFTFQAVAADEAAKPAPPAPAGTRVTKRPKAEVLPGHVLVAEGNTINRMLISAYLDEFGLTYEAVETGAAALLCLSARTYDLVIMDTGLPDYEGRQLAKCIRTMEFPSSDTAIVALSARDAKDEFEDLVAAGVNARVTKPLHGHALYAALMPLLPRAASPLAAREPALAKAG